MQFVAHIANDDREEFLWANSGSLADIECEHSEAATVIGSVGLVLEPKQEIVLQLLHGIDEIYGGNTSGDLMLHMFDLGYRYAQSRYRTHAKQEKD
jgi:hypothetical protein